MDAKDGNKGKSYSFPPISLLNIGERNNINEEEIKTTAIRIQQTLLYFGVQVQISDISVSARFTRYEITPCVGVKIKDITRHENEIRMATAATDMHIIAPIPGKPAIGIDIANRQSSIVTIREIIESWDFKLCSSNLTFAVGMDITGKIIVGDIAKMPHLLIGGTTGSGKTVCLNSIIMSILYKAHPNDVRLIMIDTKGISLTAYNGIPHLLIPVVTESRKSLLALNWCISEMQERYKRFANCGVQDMRGYNNSVNSERRMPQILIIIDDLSDLMAIYKSEAEQLIVRLAQLSRGAGMHLVIATQRPSTDVVTGLIKANIPSRISFSVFSAIDSRVILDEKGAEELLGNGDMLFKPQGCKNPIHIQGVYISDEEILNVVDFMRNQMISLLA